MLNKTCTLRTLYNSQIEQYQILYAICVFQLITYSKQLLITYNRMVKTQC